MKLSIIIPVLNSHEIVRRQMLHYQQMGLENDVEVILVDDGSQPGITDETGIAKIFRTNDSRPWTQPKARNIGASRASGEFLLFTDVDHIVPDKSVEWARNCSYDVARFRRYLAVLTEDGVITQDRDILEQYGVPHNRGLKVSCHTLSMVVRAQTFRQTGGFREKLGKHPTHDDGNMKRRLRAIDARHCPDNNPDERPEIFLIPNGRYCKNGSDPNADPLGLFHGAQR